MRAAVTENDDWPFVDVDHVFTTGAPEQELVPNVHATTTDIPPSPGIEMLALVNNGFGPTNQFRVATDDVQGNLIWYYNDPSIEPPYVPDPVKLLHDGSVLINFSVGAPDGLGAVLRDIDLAGNINWQVTAQDLAQKLSAKRLLQQSERNRFAS
jgi:hypothetical protein